jgi:hypothetical protein
MRRARTVFGLLAFAWAIPASAVIRVDLPVSKIYGVSKAVVVGTVVGVNPDSKVADIKVVETPKGESAGERFRIQVVEPEGLLKQVAAEQPVVVFVGEVAGKAVAVVHLADTWLLAQGIPGVNPPAWRTVQLYKDPAKSFPGRTAALVRLVAELKAGKASIQDEIYPEAFQGGVRELGNLKVKPIFLAAVDVNGDKKLDLVVGTASGVKLFLAGAQGYTDATEQWGLVGAIGGHGAAADVNGDGDPDLLLGKTLWLNGGGKFGQAKAALDLPAETDWLAVALADATGDKRPDAIVLLKTGKLIVLENPGAADKPWAASSKTLWEGGEAAEAVAFSSDWGDDEQLYAMVVREKDIVSGVWTPSSRPAGWSYAMVVREKDIVRYAIGPKGGAPAGFQRLTGMSLDTYKGLGSKGLKAIAAVACDLDGNGKADFLVLTEEGGVALSNRGFGTFMVNDLVHPEFKKLPFKLTATTLLAPGALQGGKAPRQNLFVLAEDGQLFEMDNSQK